MNMDVNLLLEKSEALFYSYCKKTAVSDCFEVVEPPSPVDVFVSRKQSAKSKNDSGRTKKR